MKPKLINTNPLSDCALDHRPISPEAREQYKRVQEALLRKNARGEGFPDYEPVEHIFDWIPQDVDVFGVDHIPDMIQKLAQIRILDASWRLLFTKS